MTNEDFSLTPVQLQRYEAWASELARPLWEADAAESIEVSVTFRFSSFGRSVEARMGEALLVLEDGRRRSVASAGGRKRTCWKRTNALDLFRCFKRSAPGRYKGSGGSDEPMTVATVATVEPRDAELS